MSRLDIILLVMVIGGAVLGLTLKYKEHKHFKEMEGNPQK